MAKAGDEYPRIAEKLKISADEVESAVRKFEAKRALASSDIVDMVVNTEVLTAMNGVGNRLQAAQAATRFTGAYIKDEPVFEPDHSTALEAIKVTGDLLEQVRPKGGGAAINIGINNAGHANGGGNGQGRSFEAMVRLAEQKRRLELGDGNPQTVDAEIVEDEPEEAELDDPDDAGLDEDED